MYKSSLHVLQEHCFDDLFKSLQQIIPAVCASLIKSKEETVEKKLYNHSIPSQQRHTSDLKVVKNFSARVLSKDEVDCLSQDLDYGLVPKHFDEMNAVGNIEQFFHRVTDLFQHHKSLMADLKDKDKIMTNDIRVLNTKEMTLASNIRSLTDSFRYSANRYRQQHAFIIEQNQYHQLLKQLRKDKSIVVTRPDKGCGVVLLNKDDYLAKMKLILDDSKKFKCSPFDPTISRENSLTALLRRLKKLGHISDLFYNMARPTGSHPGRLYGSPKIHKVDVPLRSVLSAIGTYNYGVGKALKQMLSGIIQNEAIIKDSFSFVEELKSLKDCISSTQYQSKCKMVSFDISSLYTNIPLNETIEIILKHLYDNDNQVSTMKRKDMKKLLEFATKYSHFLFNGQIYDQVDGVSMGSPLAPLLAEIFLQDFEKKFLPSFKQMGVLYWKRYVDDTFVLLDANILPDFICEQLSKCYPLIKFTCGTENVEDYITNSLAFLDVSVKRESDLAFKTRIYRKPTFTGLITKWDSFVPKSYKYNAISSMVYRAMRICSTHQSLHDEFENIRTIAYNNGYPEAFVESIIRRQLNLVYERRQTITKASETDVVVLRISYYGKPSQIYAKRVTAAVQKQYPLKKSTSCL